MALSLGIFRAERGGATGLHVSRKHLILAETLPSEEITVIILLTFIGEIPNNKASWTGSVSSFAICIHSRTCTFQAMSITLENVRTELL